MQKKPRRDSGTANFEVQDVGQEMPGHQQEVAKGKQVEPKYLDPGVFRKQAREKFNFGTLANKVLIVQQTDDQGETYWARRTLARAGVDPPPQRQWPLVDSYRRQEFHVAIQYMNDPLIQTTITKGGRVFVQQEQQCGMVAHVRDALRITVYMDDGRVIMCPRDTLRPVLPRSAQTGRDHRHAVGDRHNDTWEDTVKRAGKLAVRPATNVLFYLVREEPFFYMPYRDIVRRTMLNIFAHILHGNNRGAGLCPVVPVGAR